MHSKKWGICVSQCWQDVMHSPLSMPILYRVSGRLFKQNRCYELHISKLWKSVATKVIAVIYGTDVHV